MDSHGTGSGFRSEPDARPHPVGSAVEHDEGALEEDVAEDVEGHLAKGRLQAAVACCRRLRSAFHVWILQGRCRGIGGSNTSATTREIMDERKRLRLTAVPVRRIVQILPRHHHLQPFDLHPELRERLAAVEYVPHHLAAQLRAGDSGPVRGRDVVVYHDYRRARVRDAEKSLDRCGCLVRGGVATDGVAGRVERPVALSGVNEGVDQTASVRGGGNGAKGVAPHLVVAEVGGEDGEGNQVGRYEVREEGRLASGLD